MKQWIFLGVAIVSEVIGTSALKASEGFTRLWPSLIALIAWALYGQALDVPAIIGLSLIVAGVVVLNVFSSTTSHS